MRTHSAPSSHPQYRGAQPESTHNQANSNPMRLRFRREDLEKAIPSLHPDKQAFVRSLIPTDARGSHKLTVDKKGFQTFLSLLEPHERAALQGIVKDTGRSTQKPPPEAHRPVRGEDLRNPIGSHGAGPKIGRGDEDLYPLPLPPGYKFGETNSTSTKSNSPTSADQNARKETGDNSQAGQSSPSPTQATPQRIRFAEQAEVREFPRNTPFEPGELSTDSPHTVSFDRKATLPRHEAPEDWGDGQGDHRFERSEFDNSSRSFASSDSSVSKPYPPPPPAKGILKKPTQEQAGPSDQAKAPKKMFSTKNVLIGGGVAAVGLVAISALGENVGDSVVVKPQDGT